MLEDFKVKAGEFEGPLDLLLDLIEKRKLHISQVSLSQVADDFLKYIEQEEGKRGEEKGFISDLADFILIASTLILIKSKALLPTLDLSSEEEGSIEDLENRLKKYQEYKEAAQRLSKIFGNFLYFAKENKNNLTVFSPAETSISEIEQAINRVLLNLPKKAESLPSLQVKKIISLEEMIGKLSERIGKSLQTSFRDFSGYKGAAYSAHTREDKINVIVSFLAMLELVKRGAVRVAQESHFDEIQIESENVETPKY